MQIMKFIHVVYIYRISLLFSRSILTSTEIDGKNSSETEQNMSEKQGKGQIMLHLPMKFENHAMNRENKFLRRWSG